MIDGAQKRRSATGLYVRQGDVMDVNVVQWKGDTPADLTGDKVNAIDDHLDDEIATLLMRTASGVTVYPQTTSTGGRTTIGKGKRYTGIDRLHYTSDTQRDLSTDTLVALEFQEKSFPADEITGSAGAWNIYIPLTNDETDDLFAGRYNAELAVYDTSPNPDQEIPELAKFIVSVEKDL